MKKSMFYYIESIQTWVNLMQIEEVYQAKGWKIAMQSGRTFNLSDKEYFELSDKMRGVFEEKKEEPKE